MAQDHVHARQADMADGAPKAANLVPELHVTRCTALEALPASLISAELPERLGLTVLDAIDEPMGDH